MFPAIMSGPDGRGEGMTVKELVEAAPFCDTVEVIIRENGNGHWIQGYLIGKNINIYPAFQRKDWIEYRKSHNNCHFDKRMLKAGEEVEGTHGGGGLPMKLIKKSVSNIPDKVANLQVCSFQPRHISSYHKEPLTHNEFQLDICSYPEGWELEKEQPETKDNVSKQIPGQMNLLDFME